jgi:hypothetical protein
LNDGIIDKLGNSNKETMFNISNLEKTKFISDTNGHKDVTQMVGMHMDKCQQ